LRAAHLDREIVRILRVVHLHERVAHVLVKRGAASRLDLACHDAEASTHSRAPSGPPGRPRTTCRKTIKCSGRLLPPPVVHRPRLVGGRGSKVPLQCAKIYWPAACEPRASTTLTGVHRPWGGHGRARLPSAVAVLLRAHARWEHAPNAGCDVLDTATAPPSIQHEPLSKCTTARLILFAVAPYSGTSFDLERSSVTIIFFEIFSFDENNLSA
jgi:hypothetical protein